MRGHVKVNLWGETIGLASWNEMTRCATFQYTPDAIDDGSELSPIVMPLSKELYLFDGLNRDTYHGLPGLLADSLPDRFGESLIDLWLDRNGIGRADFNPLDRLCYVGRRGMGALEYEPASNVRDDISDVDVDRLSLLATRVLKEREGFSMELSDDGIEQLISLGTSAGGARAKAIVALDEKTGEIRSGQIDQPDRFSQWIIKFDTESGTEKGFCRTEYAYHQMAKDCGMEMTDCRLLETERGSHFMTKRFDRIGAEKVHMQTLCSLAHFDNRSAGRYSYEQLFMVMRMLRLPYVDQEQMFRRAVFNIVMRNNDDHTKNFSFLLRKGKAWRLSPAYDLTFAYSPGNLWIGRHQMTMNGKVDGIDRKDINKFAHDVGIRNHVDIVDKIVAVASDWGSYAEENKVPKQYAKRIEDSLLTRL